VNAPSGKERESSLSAALLDGDDPALFPKLTKQQLELLRPLGRVRDISVDEVLFRDGDAAYDPMVVLAGRVSVLEGGGDGARELVGQRAGDLMAELNLFTGQPVGATGVVREAGSVLVIPAQEFRALVGRELVFGDFVLQLLFRRRQALERLLIGIRIVGSRFDRDTHRLREFAARNRVAHEWLDSEEPRAGSLLDQRGLSAASGPVVLLGGERVLRDPSNAELANALGLHQAPIPDETSFDHRRHLRRRARRTRPHPGRQVRRSLHDPAPRDRIVRARRLLPARAGGRRGAANPHRHPRARRPVPAAADRGPRRLRGARRGLRDRQRA
jgi:CRP-like cAMP-binding protein